jgi:hypothetical protein
MSLMQRLKATAVPGSCTGQCSSYEPRGPHCKNRHALATAGSRAVPSQATENLAKPPKLAAEGAREQGKSDVRCKKGTSIEVQFFFVRELFTGVEFIFVSQVFFEGRPLGEA